MHPKGPLSAVLLGKQDIKMTPLAWLPLAQCGFHWFKQPSSTSLPFEEKEPLQWSPAFSPGLEAPGIFFKIRKSFIFFKILNIFHVSQQGE